MIKSRSVAKVAIGKLWAIKKNRLDLFGSFPFYPRGKRLRTYFKEMERLGLESGVFGVNRILNEVKSLEQGIVRSEDFIDRFLRGDPESEVDNFRLGLLGRIKRDERILADLSRKEIDAGFRLKSIQEAASGKGLTRKQLKEMQRLEKGLLTEKQQKYKKELRERLEANKLQLAEIERWRSDPDSFKDVDLKDIMNRGVGVVGAVLLAHHRCTLAEVIVKGSPLLGNLLLENRNGGIGIPEHHGHQRC